MLHLWREGTHPTELPNYIEPDGLWAMQAQRTHKQGLPKSLSAQAAGSNLSANVSEGPKLVGETNEVLISINGIEVKALLDTGSCVSAIAESFYLTHLQHLELQPIGDILNIECADGKNLPYKGYIEVELAITSGLPKATPQHCLLLVTPDTSYSSSTPIIIGTNVLNELLEECQNNFGPQYLQRAKLFFPWYLSFRCMAIRARALKHSNGRIAVVKSASSEKITIHPNQSIDVVGYVDKELDYPNTTVMLQEVKDSILYPNVDVDPTVVQYKYKGNGQILVSLSNITTQTVTIPPRALLCEMQPVTVVDDVIDKHVQQASTISVDTLNIDEDNMLDDHQKSLLKTLLQSHADIF